MKNLPKQNELPFDLAHFQVEELEERLENKWGRNSAPTTKSCLVSVTTYADGSGKSPFFETGTFPIDTDCPDTKYCIQTSSIKACY